VLVSLPMNNGRRQRKILLGAGPAVGKT